MKLSDYEKRFDFQKRAALAAAEVRVALATGRDVDGDEIIRVLGGVPHSIALQWLGKIAVQQLGETRITLSVVDGHRGLPS